MAKSPVLSRYQNGLQESDGVVSPVYGASANTIAQGNDARFSTFHILHVKKNPGAGEFSSIVAALATITDADPLTNPYLILVGPGVYVEDTLTMKSGVFICGSGHDVTIIEVDDPSKHVVVGADESGISHCRLQGATDPGSCAIFFQGLTSTTNTAFWAENIRFGDVDSLVIADGTDSPSAVFVQNGKFGGQHQFNRGFTARAGGRVIVLDSTTTGLQSPYPDFVFIATGVGSQIVANGVQIRSGSGLSPGCCFFAEDSGLLRVSSVNVRGFAKAVWMDGVGGGPRAEINAILCEFNTVDLQIDHPGADGTMAGSFSHQKIIVDPDSAFAVDFTCNNMPDDKTGHVTVGTILQGDRYDRLLNLSELARSVTTLGLLRGGVITVVGLNTIEVSEGKGYLEDDTEFFVKELIWSTGQLVLAPGDDKYIFINNAGVITSDSARPSFLQAIQLGRVVVDPSGNVEIIEATPMDMNHLGNKVEEYLRLALGPIVSTGLAVSESMGSPRKLTLTNGVIRYGTIRIAPSGGVDILFDAYYSDGSGGFDEADDLDTVPNNLYDDGSGTPAAVPSGKYVGHILYVSGEGVDEQHFLRYGTQYFDTALEAINADIPTAPGFIKNAVTRLAKIIVQEGNNNIVQVVDIRPRIGFAAPSSAAATNHNDLTGRGDPDAHTQYLLIDGTRVMTGALNMGGNNITNGGTYNGVTVQAHASRHSPLGADPLATGTPVDITDSTNDAGNSNNYALGNHRHAHGNRGGGSLHAVATPSVAGFMSAADKTKLDGVEAGATNTPLGSATPQPLGTAAPGTSPNVSHEDHVHAHGNQGGGSQHSNASTSTAGFMSAADKTKLDGIEAGATADQVASEVPVTPAGNISSTDVQAALQELDSEKQALSEKGQANGYAALDGSGKVPVNQLPDTVVGAVDYKGTWNANTNTPNLGALTPDKGDYYVVNVAGTTSLGGIADWNVGDWAIYNGTAWEKVDNTDQVTSVFGRQGTVVAQSGDYNASQVTNTPAGGIAATNVQDAINELDTEKVAKTTTVSAGNGLTGGGDLSANRSLAVQPHADGSIVAGGSGVQVGVLATDAQHGARGGGTQHAVVTTSVNGFMSAADKVKLDLLRAITVYNMDSVRSPNNANWAINAFAPMSTDPTNGAELVRRFDDTAEEGVGFYENIPPGAVNMTISLKGRAITAPGAAQGVVMRLYRRTVPNNAAIGAWSAALQLTTLSIPTNANYQYFASQTISLATLGLTAGTRVLMELTRHGANAADTLTGDFALAEITIEYT